MAKCDFEKRFRDMMVHEAAQDRFFRGTLEWLLFGKTDLVPESFIDNVDESQLAADIGQHYALDPKGVQLAYEICEQNIVRGLTHGEA